MKTGVRQQNMISRREWLAGSLAAGSAWATERHGTLLIESHVHLFAGDPARFPYSPLTYQPEPLPVERYVSFARLAKIDHALIVHPEPYQDDHRYLEYCLAHEPAKGFFKGTCLFDPIDPRTPGRMRALIQRNPGRIVALRIHEVHPPGTPSTTGGAIRDRDLGNPDVARVWRAAGELGLAIQVNCIPEYASQIGELAKKFRDVPLILDHLGHLPALTSRAAAQYDDVLRLADLPRAYVKFTRSGVRLASTQDYPHLDAKPILKRVFAAFGADRIMWGELGDSMEEFDQAARLFEVMFDFITETERARIRGLTALKLFAFS